MKRNYPFCPLISRTSLWTVQEEWEEEIISSEEDGLVIFDGGTYSRGPSSLLAMEDFYSEDADLQADKERLERQLSLEVGQMYPNPVH